MAIESLIVEIDPTYKTDIDETNKTLEVVLCIRCGRPLTNEKSRLAHIGPKCARKLAYEIRTHSYSTKTLNCQKLLPTICNQEENIPTKYISLHYTQDSSQKPYCKIGVLSLSAIDTNSETSYSNRKRSYCLLLIEGITYQIFEPLPRPRIFLLQVKNQQLIDIGNQTK